MSQANVYNANIANATWYTDKAEIVNGSNSDRVVWNVYVMPIGNQVAAGVMYSNAAVVNPGGRQQIYVGAGNKLTVNSSGLFTVREIGTASSAQEGVIGGGSY
jgi:hypothetical protein